MALLCQAQITGKPLLEEEMKVGQIGVECLPMEWIEGGGQSHLIPSANLC